MIRRMPKAGEHLPVSAFWRRLTEAFAERGLPTSQNGVAKSLHMSQGSVQGWVRAEYLPSMDNVVRIADKAGVCVQWLLTGEGPKKAEPQDPQFLELAEIWSHLTPERQAEVLRFAHFQLGEQPHSFAAERNRKPTAPRDPAPLASSVSKFQSRK